MNLTRGHMAPRAGRPPRFHPRLPARPPRFKTESQESGDRQSQRDQMMPPVEGQALPLSSGRVAGVAPPPGAGAGGRCTWAAEAIASPAAAGLSVLGTHLHLNAPD